MAVEPSGTPAGRDEAQVRRFVENLALFFADWGFPRMSARVLFVLMTADEPGLTAPELAERTGASPAAISGAVRYLAQLGLAVREAVPGSRRDLYKLGDDVWRRTTVTQSAFYHQMISAADEGVAALGGAGTAAGARVEEMREFFAFLRDESDGLMERWAERRARLHGDAARDAGGGGAADA